MMKLPSFYLDWKSKEVIDQVEAISSTTKKDTIPSFFDRPLPRVGGYSKRPGRGGGQISGKGNRQYQQSRKVQQTKK